MPGGTAKVLWRSTARGASTKGSARTSPLSHSCLWGEVRHSWKEREAYLSAKAEVMSSLLATRNDFFAEKNRQN